MEPAADVEALAARDELRRLAVGLEPRAVDGGAWAEECAHTAIGASVEVAATPGVGARCWVVRERRRRGGCNQRRRQARRGRLRRRRARRRAGRRWGRRGREPVADADAELRLGGASEWLPVEGPRCVPDRHLIGATLWAREDEDAAAGPLGPTGDGARVQERQPGGACNRFALVPRRLARAARAQCGRSVSQPRCAGLVQRPAGRRCVNGAHTVQQRHVVGLGGGGGTEPPPWSQGRVMWRPEPRGRGRAAQPPGRGCSPRLGTQPARPKQTQHGPWTWARGWSYHQGCKI